MFFCAFPSSVECFDFFAATFALIEVRCNVVVFARGVLILFAVIFLIVGCLNGKQAVVVSVHYLFGFIRH